MIAALSMRLSHVTRLPTPLRYVLAFALIAAVTALVVGFPAVTPSAPYIVYFPVIVFCAVIFDHGSSVFATFLATAASAYFLLEPRGSLRVDSGGDVLGLAIFVLTALLTAAMVEALRHAVELTSDANAKLLHAHADIESSKRLLDAIFEQTPDPIYVKDGNGRFVHLNMAAAELLGTTPSTAIGLVDRNFLPAEQAAAIEAHDRAVIAAGTSQVVEELVSKPGQPAQLFLSTKSPWRGAGGEPLGVLGISRDISKRKEAEEALRLADSAKQLLLYDINHRIKNHLQSVAGLMAIAARRATTLEAAQAALTASAGRLTVLGQVYTRLQLGSGASVVDVRSFIEELCSALGNSLVDSRAIVIRVDAIEVSLEAERAVTVGLFVNELVQNALKYAFPDDRAGSVRVRFRAEGDSFQLTVEDDGVGFDADAAPRGTGNGRRLVRAMAQQLGGQLEITGTAGTRAVLTFPRLLI